MKIEEGDRVLLRDRHSDHDGEVGRVTRVMETMFGDARCHVEFRDGVESGVPADSLVPSEDSSESAEQLLLFKPFQFDSCSLN